MTVPIFVKNLPSGGIFISKKDIPKYDRETFYIDVEPLTYGKMMEYSNAKDNAPNIVKKLQIMIDYLIPPEFRDFPICDMYCIMAQISIISGLDLLDDPENTDLNKPYYLTNVTCPYCGKVHKKISFNLSNLDYTKFSMPILSGEVAWQDVHQFSNGETYTFTIPTINQFYKGLEEYIEMMGSDIPNSIQQITKLVSLSLAFNRLELNKKITVGDFKTNFENFKNVFYNMTGSDAMRVERMYSELIQPVVLFKDFCDCGGGSVIDVTYYITDVLRLLINNSERVISKIYVLPKEIKSGSDFSSVQFGNDSIFSSHQEIRRRIDRENEEKSRDRTERDGFYD